MRTLSRSRLCTAAAAAFLTSFAATYPQFLLAALGVGVAGASFSVGAAYVSSFYPPVRQGLVLGVFGAGNAGAANCWAASCTAGCSSSGCVKVRNRKLMRSSLALAPNCAPRSAQASTKAFSSRAGR